MNEKVLLETIEELVKENKKLKCINNYLYESIKTIKEEASCICAIQERQNMTDVCKGILMYLEKLSEKLGVKINE